MKSTLKFLSFAAILAVAASPAARAQTDSSLTQGPGVYFGNPANSLENYDFNVVTSGNVQLGLEAINRFLGPISPSGNNYTYMPGESSPGDATWDFEFSINTGAATLNSVPSYSITILDDTTGNTSSFDPTTVLTDNGQSIGSTIVCRGTTSSPCPAYDGSTLTGIQNAENLGFGFLPGFNPDAHDTYTITLAAGSVTDSINVVPTPEPSSLILLGTGLVSAAGTVLRRRRLA